MDNNRQQHESDLRHAFAEDVVNDLRRLLETKHLYQSVSMEFGNANRVVQAAPPDTSAITKPTIFRNEVLRENPTPVQAKERGIAASKRTISNLQAAEWHFQIDGVQPTTSSHTHFSVPTIRIPCAFCDGILPPHNPGFKGCREHPDVISPSTDPKTIVQLFSIPFQCQNCHGEMVVFYVRRDGKKLQIVGRSQFESVTVPKEIPKQESEHYVDAIIAFNTGRSLAGLFFLRTFIEQYMRRVTKNSDPRTPGDLLAENYHALLDKEFPNKYRTFRTMYGELSDRLHRAVSDNELVVKSRKEIDEHFSMLKMIPIPAGDEGKDIAK